MGTALTYYRPALLARETLTCGTQHVHLPHHDSLLQPVFFSFLPPQSTAWRKTDPGMFNVGCILTAVPRDFPSWWESAGYIYFSTEKSSWKKRKLSRKVQLIFLPQQINRKNVINPHIPWAWNEKHTHTYFNTYQVDQGHFAPCLVRSYG